MLVCFNVGTLRTDNAITLATRKRENIQKSNVLHYFLFFSLKDSEICCVVVPGGKDGWNKIIPFTSSSPQKCQLLLSPPPRPTIAPLHTN